MPAFKDLTLQVPPGQVLTILEWRVVVGEVVQDDELLVAFSRNGGPKEFLLSSVEGRVREIRCPVGTRLQSAQVIARIELAPAR